MRLDPLHFWLLALALCVAVIVAVCLLPYGDAMTLEISGHCAGQGFQNLSFVGDLLNVSILQNGSTWNLSLVGCA